MLYNSDRSVAFCTQFDEVRHLAEAVVELLGEVREESSVPGAVFEGLLRYGSGHEPSVPPRMGAMLAMATMAQNVSSCHPHGGFLF